MIDLYSTLPKKNNNSSLCERVAGRPTARHIYLARWTFAGGLVGFTMKFILLSLHSGPFFASTN